MQTIEDNAGDQPFVRNDVLQLQFGTLVLNVEPGFTTEWSPNRRLYDRLPLRLELECYRDPLGDGTTIQTLAIGDQAKHAIGYSFLLGCAKECAFGVNKDDPATFTIGVGVRLSSYGVAYHAATVRRSALLGEVTPEEYAAHYFGRVFGAASAEFCGAREAELAWRMAFLEMFTARPLFTSPSEPVGLPTERGTMILTTGNPDLSWTPLRPVPPTAPGIPAPAATAATARPTAPPKLDATKRRLRL